MRLLWANHQMTGVWPLTGLSGAGNGIVKGDAMTSAQEKVIAIMREGAVIGELTDKVNGLYELFVRSPNWQPSNHPLDHPFVVQRLNKNTFFALLAEGRIVESDAICPQMLPFSRDAWYVLKGE